MSDTTTLDDIPDGNVKMEIDVDPEMMRRVSESISASPEVDVATLPPKHISKNAQMESLMQDPEASPTYVPPPTRNAIPVRPGDLAENIVMSRDKKKARWLSFDNLLDDAKYPMLLAVLYFLFQVPQVRGVFRRIFPFGYNEDDTANTVGYAAHSVAFAACAFIIANSQEKLINLLG